MRWSSRRSTRSCCAGASRRDRTATGPRSPRRADGSSPPTNPDGEATLAFQKIDDYQRPTWPGGTHPQQFHLDFAVPDIEAAEPRVLTLGAAVHEHQPSGSGSFRVYVDPAGHPFCLVHGA